MVITKEEAIKLAKTRNSLINAYQEYADAYEFYIDNDDVYEGGSNCSFVVEKQTGNILRWPDYFMDSSRNVIEIGEPEIIE